MADVPLRLRLSTAWQALTGQVDPNHQPDPAPIRQSSPSEENAEAAGGMMSRSLDAFAIGRAWLEQLALNDDSVLRKEGGGGPEDLKLYDALLDDENAQSAFQQRQLALVSRPWTVDPGDDKDPRSVKAAEDLKAMIDALGWDRVCSLMMFGRWYGYAVAEGIYEIREHDGRSMIWLADIVVPNRNWFGFSNEGELRMRTVGNADGTPVPPNKFWSYRVGGTHDFAMYGTGLAHWCYWPIWFKRNVIKFWALYLEKFGQPTAVGFIPPGSTDKKIADLLSALSAVGTDSAVALPMPPAGADGKPSEALAPKLMEANRSGGADSYRQFLERMDDAVTRTILGQTMTSKAAAGGIGSNQADVHADVKQELVKADSDALHESFNSTFPVWLTLWNYGPDVAPPRVYRTLEDEEDLNTVAERDEKIKRLGWVRTEESFTQTYGEGYEKAPEPVIDPATGLPKPGMAGKPPRAANDKDGKAPGKMVAFAADTPRPLYVKRDLVNLSEVRKWAKAQGIADRLNDDLHVTLLYSRTPVNWLDMGEGWGGDETGKISVKPGGVRLVDHLGPKGAVVLHFVKDEFGWRHREMIEKGASSDHDGYQAHVTLFSDPDFDPKTVEPYRGKLVFGPEYFEALDDGVDDIPPDPSDEPAELAFSAEQLEQIEQLAAAMTEETDGQFALMGDLAQQAIRKFSAGGDLTAEGLRIALLEAWERFPIDKLAKAMALPLLAEHAAAAVGAEAEVSA